jgi:DNA repair exonuclease SbcCD ATPase subunit
MTIVQLRNHIEQQKGRKEQIIEEISSIKEEIKEKKRNLRRHEEAREIVRIVALKTQSQLQYHISDIVSLALEAVYDNPYTFVTEFVQRRNKTECDLYFSRDDAKIDPMDASGGGTVNVAGFALRVASWSMQRPKLRNVLILDEPMGQLSIDKQERASEMLKQISQKLGIQILMVTHSEILTSSADRIFRVSIKNGVSQVVQE